MARKIVSVSVSEEEYSQMQKRAVKLFKTESLGKYLKLLHRKYSSDSKSILDDFNQRKAIDQQMIRARLSNIDCLLSAMLFITDDKSIAEQLESIAEQLDQLQNEFYDTENPRN